MNILITGAAGFIGFFLSRAIAEQGNAVFGIDNLNNYYSVSLKRARLDQLNKFSGFSFAEMDIADRKKMKSFFKQNDFDIVVHLAAQAGVRYSIDNPHAYVDSNLVGFANILEGCRQQKTAHLVYASSSSVYGANTKMPFSTVDNVDYPVSLYAATKKSNELMAHAYSHLYNLPITGLRFFTVYGPWGRPDMAYFKFTKAILEGAPIDVYNHGRMKRDFTYIDDIVEAILKVMGKNPVVGAGKLSPTTAPYRLLNIGNNMPVALGAFIETLEQILHKKAVKNMLPMQPGDVPATFADISDLTALTGFKPKTSIKKGLSKFVKWYKTYYSYF